MQRTSASEARDQKLAGPARKSARRRLYARNIEMASARWRQGLSLPALAEIAKISAKHAREIENGYAWPSEATAGDIARALEVEDPLDLFPLDRPRNRRRGTVAA